MPAVAFWVLKSFRARWRWLEAVSDFKAVSEFHVNEPNSRVNCAGWWTESYLNKAQRSLCSIYMSALQSWMELKYSLIWIFAPWEKLNKTILPINMRKGICQTSKSPVCLRWTVSLCGVDTQALVSTLHYRFLKSENRHFRNGLPALWRAKAHV